MHNISPFQEKDETDSGYRSGTIPDEKLPPKPSDATLNREELKKKIAEFNKLVQGANFALVGGYWTSCMLQAFNCKMVTLVQVSISLIWSDLMLCKYLLWLHILSTVYVEV